MVSNRLGSEDGREGQLRSQHCQNRVSKRETAADSMQGPGPGQALALVFLWPAPLTASLSLGIHATTVVLVTSMLLLLESVLGHHTTAI